MASSTLCTATSKSTTASPGEVIDLLLCCGDVECLRNTINLDCLACPERYRHMSGFPEYYIGEKRAPVLTILIGGNHEASNYFQELHYGGWVAPNMFYLGAAGVINVMGLRIGGISGIYGPKDYRKGHYERVPYSKKALIAKDTFGSVGGELLLHHLKPRHWFAGHMPVRFEATVEHDTAKTTQFLALDKCYRNRPWFEVVDVAPSLPTPPLRANGDARVLMDVEWLAILRATHHVMSRRPNDISMPVQRSSIKDSDLKWMRCALEETTVGDRVAVEWTGDFEVTAPSHGHEDELRFDGSLGNPQTDPLLDLLKLPHVVTSLYAADDGEGSHDSDDDDLAYQHKENTANDEFLEHMMVNFQF